MLTALFVVGTSAACSNLSQRCNAIGGEPGVMVVIQRPWPSQTVTAQVCIADTCRSATIPAPLRRISGVLHRGARTPPNGEGIVGIGASA